MSDVISLARRVGLVEVAPQFTDYSKVIINVDKDTVIEVGNDTGRTLEFDNPFGTQAMANDILAKLNGFQYQPYTATDALLDPAAEIGDAANIRGSYGGIYQRERRFSEAMPANIAAPQDEEINHEYQFETPQEREFTRQIDDVKASLIIANDRIDASVSQTGGTNSTFGWSLTSTGHRWYAGNKEVMAVTAAGLAVTGEVTATTGKIGGFNITASSLWNNLSSFGGTQNSGVYIGTNGIQLGQAFKVTSSGQVTATNISANNMTLTGTLNIGGTNITAAALRGGAQSAYSYGGTWTNTSNAWGNATTNNTNNYPTYFTVANLNAKNRCDAAFMSVSNTFNAAGTFNVGGITATWKQVTINGTTIKYLGRS